MHYLLTTAESYEADRRASKDFDIPPMVLMENAARSAAEIILARLAKVYPAKPLDTLRVIILCGSGNNGGDGYAIARHLHEKLCVAVAWMEPTKSMSKETFANFEIVNALKIPQVILMNSEDFQHLDFRQFDCVVDCLIGIGGGAELRGMVVPLLQKLHEYNHSGKWKSPLYSIAIDCPTGLDTTTGEAHEMCFEADLTITMYAEKIGLRRNAGPAVCGEITVATIGAPMNILPKVATNARLEANDIRRLLPARKRETSKFDYGRVVLIAGSVSMPGAAALCANAAITAGAGLVELYATAFHPMLLPEIIQKPQPKTENGTLAPEAFDALLAACRKAQSVVIGPGIGDNVDTITMLTRLLAEIPTQIPVLIDADGLRIISPKSILRSNILLTPHAGEFHHLTGIDREEISKKSVECAVEYAQKTGCTLLLKGVPTIITDGKFSYWNCGGNPGLATAGSGDVLSGIIAGLLAQSVAPLEAGALGAYLHAAAGDWYAEKYSCETLTASKIIECFAEVIPH